MIWREVEEWIRTHTCFDFSRSSGPGGQNVNKVNTKATARLSIDDMDVLVDREKVKIRECLKKKVNVNDEIVVTAQRARTQYRNRKMALNRLVSLVLFALQKGKKRITTQPTRASMEKRLREKRIISQKKRLRKPLE